ncbi:hypothetical protein [Chitinophaga rhizosphaerae]|uniref:hypothetical protein n=1 Tax=Chitinophaga rhizosphaerae TaxID=1864947 RepID=UPI000F80A81E|nr:hypothetical protein [Chitinophaga rhizosphaerae]
MGAVELANQHINDVLSSWSKDVTLILQRAIRERGLVLTEELVRSLHWELIKASEGQVAQARLGFRLHGRWRDMRTIARYRRPPVEVILQDFVARLGTGAFKYIPGYAPGRVPTESVALRRLAWGISSGILKRKQTAARKWYSKNFYSSINSLLESLLVKYQELPAAALKTE